MGTDIFEKIDVHLQNHRMGTWTGNFRGLPEHGDQAAVAGTAGARPTV